MNKPVKPVKKSASRTKKLVELIVELKEKECMSEIADMLEAGWDPLDLLESCVRGMQQIGQRFENGRYYISALIMAGAIMRQTTELLEPHLKGQKTERMIGTLLLGTVAGDIHDLGKNLFAILARFSGIKIVDLGVDVPAETFLSEARKIRPEMIGLSCVLTTAWPEMKKTIALLRKELPHPKPAIIIGGTCIDEHICRHVNSDYWVRDASEGLAICQRIMNQKTEE